MRLLLVEDDLALAQGVLLALRSQNFTVNHCALGRDALASIRAGDCDAVVLDLGLPDLDGFEVLRQTRHKFPRLPVLILTARDGLDDRIKGLDLGADDYLVKPFEFKELLARIRAISRRSQGQADPILDNGVLKLNPATKEVSRADQVVRLSSREFSLLLALMQHPGTIMSRSDLEERIYGWNEEVESNAIEFLIHSLRKKLGSDCIKNVRGLGWFVDKAV